MPRITTSPAQGRVTVRAGATVIADTTRAVELREGAMPPVLYIPREDATVPLERTATRSTCPHKGEASYYALGGVQDAAWSYETPHGDAKPIAGHLAFYPSRVSIEHT